MHRAAVQRDAVPLTQHILPALFIAVLLCGACIVGSAPDPPLPKSPTPTNKPPLPQPPSPNLTPGPTASANPRSALPPPSSLGPTPPQPQPLGQGSEGSGAATPPVPNAAPPPTTAPCSPASSSSGNAWCHTYTATTPRPASTYPPKPPSPAPAPEPAGTTSRTTPPPATSSATPPPDYRTPSPASGAYVPSSFPATPPPYSTLTPFPYPPPAASQPTTSQPPLPATWRPLPASPPASPPSPIQPAPAPSLEPASASAPVPPPFPVRSPGPAAALPPGVSMQQQPPLPAPGKWAAAPLPGPTRGPTPPPSPTPATEPGPPSPAPATKAGPPSPTPATEPEPPSPAPATKAGPPSPTPATEPGPPSPAPAKKAGPPSPTPSTNPGPPSPAPATKAGPPSPTPLTEPGPPSPAPARPSPRLPAPAPTPMPTPAAMRPPAPAPAPTPAPAPGRSPTAAAAPPPLPLPAPPASPALTPPPKRRPAPKPKAVHRQHPPRPKASPPPSKPPQPVKPPSPLSRPSPPSPAPRAPVKPPRPPRPPPPPPLPPSPRPTPPRPPAPPRPPLPPAAARPNFVIVLADDLDDLYNSTAPKYMPAMNRHLGQGGTRMSNFIVSTGVCCPARTSLLTGKLAHCTNVTSNTYPEGGFSKFLGKNLESNWLPSWLQSSGYYTALCGKFLNQYFETVAPPGYKPNGWDAFEALSFNAYNLTNSCFSLNGKPSKCYPGQYQTDLIADKARDYISAAAAVGKPFLMYVAPTAPHRVSTEGVTWQPPTPAARHANLYADDNIQSPRSPNWGIRNPALPRKGATAVDAAFAAIMDSLHLARLRSMRAVDDLVDSLVTHLSDLGILNNTYVIFTSDNGYHMGAFSLYDGKNLPIEEDIRVPFYIRGPGIPAGQVLPYQGNLVDIAPTLMVLAGLTPAAHLDGLPLPIAPKLLRSYLDVLRSSNASDPSQLSNASRIWPAMSRATRSAAAKAGALGVVNTPTNNGAALPGMAPPDTKVPNAAASSTTSTPIPTTADDLVGWRDVNILEGWNGDGTDRSKTLAAHYKSLRVCTDSQLLPPPAANGNSSATTTPATPQHQAARYVFASGVSCYKYTVWCQGVKELYDLSADPFEINNRIGNVSVRVLDRLDAVLSALVHCSGASCRNPYSLLHPGGGVSSFTGALDRRYDTMYGSLQKLWIKQCIKTYLPTNEVTWTQGVGPQPNAF